MSITLETVYIPSDEIVARDIDGEVIIVPLAAGVGDLEDEFFALNETGCEVWRRLDGKRSLAEIIAQLSEEFDASPNEIRQDVLGLIEELLKRRMLVAVR